MSKPTLITLFSGFGGVTGGFIAAGYQPVLSVEKDEKIAGVYTANFGSDHLRVADVCAVDYRPFAGADAVAASPVCTRYSRANQKGKESPVDLATAAATARCIEEVRPRVVMIENVPDYFKSDSRKIITDKMDELGYFWHHAVLNSADFGTAQTRERVIVRGYRDCMGTPLPAKKSWRGWYQAVAPFLASCPESELANWQAERLRKKYGDNFMECLLPQIEQGPKPKAVLIDGDNAGKCGPIENFADRPAKTVTGSGGMPRAILMSEQYAQASGSDDRVPQVFATDTPACTVLANHCGKFRAILIAGGSAGSESIPHAMDGEPCPTIKANAGTREPLGAVLSDAVSPYRIVSLTIPCIAAIQDFPPEFIFAEGKGAKGLNATGIGNAVPWRMVEGIGRSLMEAL